MSFRLFTLFMVIVVSGCASNPMAVSPNQTIQPSLYNEAQVIFMRSSFVGSAISASLYDVTDGDIEFIGVIANGTKLSYKTTEGKHVFMVVSEAADFMEAEVAAGKNYYSLVTPRMGAWKARFSLWPIKNNPQAEHHTESSAFKAWVNNTKLVVNSDKSNAWYENNKESVRAKYEKYWPAWGEKSPEDLAKRTLMPQDGM